MKSLIIYLFDVYYKHEGAPPGSLFKERLAVQLHRLLSTESFLLLPSSASALLQEAALSYNPLSHGIVNPGDWARSENKDLATLAQHLTHWWMILTPELSASFAKAMASLHGSLISTSAQSCFPSLLSQVLLSTKHLASQLLSLGPLLGDPMADIHTTIQPLSLYPDPA